MMPQGNSDMTTAAITSEFQIRTYRPGDEDAQVAIYNAATAQFPGFKKATVDDVQRRYRAPDFDPQSKIYAFRDGTPVGYVSFSDNGRVSVPWCIADAADARGVLMETMLEALRTRGHRTAWAAYRGDWTEVRSLLESHGFEVAREIVNFVAELKAIPRAPAAPPYRIEPLRRKDVPEAFRVDPKAFGAETAEALGEAWMNGPYLSDDDFFVLRDGLGRVAGVALAVVNSQYADPTKIDSAMPCFRLGAIGTERERTKRVNGLFSFIAEPTVDVGQVGSALLAEACQRFGKAGLTNVAAQCPTDRLRELDFYRSRFQTQQSFPVFLRKL
jgi:predicted N-acetyltransferase YhbS